MITISGPVETLTTKARVFLACAVVVAFGCIFLSWILWDTTLITNDGLQYLSTASNWLSGEGFSTNALIYDPHFQGRLPAYQTVWPIAFPFLIGVVSSLGLDLYAAGLLINILCHALSAWLVYLILRRCQVGRLFGLSCALLFYFTTIGWYYTVSILSESLFTCLILGAVLCLPDRDGRQAGRLAISGLLIAACIWVRLSGIFTAFSFGAALFCLFLYESRQMDWVGYRSKIGGIVLFSVFPVAGFAVWLLRTQYLIGDIKRNTGVGEAHSLLSVVGKVAEEGAILLGFRDGLIFSSDVDKWLFILFTLLALCIVITAFVLAISKPGQKRGVPGYKVTLSFVLLTHAVVFCGYLAYSRVTTVPLDFMARYLYQVYPGLFILFCLLVVFVFDEASRRGNSGVLLRPVVGGLVALYVVAQINMVTVFRDFSVRGIDAQLVMDLPVTEGVDFSMVVESCVGAVDSPDAASLWSNEGSLLHLSAGVPTITLTSMYTTPSYDFEQFKSNIETYDIRMFVFVNNMRNQDVAYSQMLGTIKEWLDNNNYAKLEMLNPMVESGTTIDVYSTDGSCFDVSKKNA